MRDENTNLGASSRAILRMARIATNFGASSRRFKVHAIGLANSNSDLAAKQSKLMIPGEYEDVENCDDAYDSTQNTTYAINK